VATCVCDVSLYVCACVCVCACACVDVCMQVLWSPTTFGPLLTCVTCVREEDLRKEGVYQDSIESLSLIYRESITPPYTWALEEHRVRCRLRSHPARRYTAAPSTRRHPSMRKSSSNSPPQYHESSKLALTQAGTGRTCRKLSPCATALCCGCS
jgi:hypothetical protein